MFSGRVCVRAASPTEEARQIKFMYDMDWFPYEEWPAVHQKIAIKDHLSQLERYNFVVFLVGNGLPPSEVWAMLYEGPVGHRRKYDNAAVNQVNNILANFRSYTSTYYDMTEKCYLRIGDDSVVPVNIR